ncbi:MAG: ammonia-forming cytochrome c nitrite reductase subunit c552, partial [Chloroflexi bacterium]|nr:ammonia-forming cytochrome c nitrite reductase subunit c552 [Chloroflexota bacterium]
CLACHGQPGKIVSLESGETLLLTIDTEKFADSVHGHEGVACIECHTGITKFPHPERSAHSLREISLQFYTSCKQCHVEQYEKTLDSVHERALAGGNTNAAICTDCHNPHTQTRMTDPDSGELLPEARLYIPNTCARCHSAVYDVYKESVHGAALTEFGNLDVPTCIDCHGVHDIPDPMSSAFRLRSPMICSKCHADPAVMDKYGISTDVLDTYVADFHGTTVTLFEKRSPDQETNKPVCFDCHGIHNIKQPDDPEYGIAMKENLLITCQRCHPDADANFPDAWMSHYIPDAEHYAVVYYVNLFYKILIPVVIGGMLLFVISDIVRRVIEWRKGAAHS